MKNRIHILLSKAFERNEYAFAAPICYNRKLISSLGIDVKFFFDYGPQVTDCDTLIISSKYARHAKLWSDDQPVYSLLEDLKSKVSHLIWADLSDGTGTCQFGVIDLVDRYIKSSLLKDRSQYKKSYYGGRVFADYYHRAFGVMDAKPAETHLNLALKTQEQLDKLKVGWNQYMLDYSYWGNYKEKVYRRLKKIPSKTGLSFKEPGGKRLLPLNSRISTNYTRNTVSFQRKKIKELLGDTSPTDRITPKAYYAELTHSQYVLSPFGWGEVCYRDFEAILAGSVLIKPDCEHLDTWPDFYQSHKTYLPFSWGLEDFEALLAQIKEMPEEHLAFSENAQALYKSVLYEPEGRQSFAQKFKELVTFTDTKASE